MKTFILIFGLVFSGIADSCRYYGLAAKTSQIKALALTANSIVWVELLSLRVEYPPLEQIESDISSPASTLEELLALVKRDKIRRSRNPPTITTSFNYLHLLKGNPVELNSICEKCVGFSSTLYNRMAIGKKYILFYKNKRIIGATEIIDTEDYQRISAIINEAHVEPQKNELKKL